jgi:drug/metabolite transporter (DMT)-like permease
VFLPYGPARVGSESPRPVAATSARRRVVVGWFALVAVYILWGTTYNAISLGDRTMPPLLFAGTRFLIAGLILFPIAGRATAPWRIPRRQWIASLITGLLMLAGGNGLVAIAETRIPGGIAALLVATVPIWVLLIDAAVNRTRIRWPAVLAILLGLTGVVVLVQPTRTLHLDLIGAGIVLLGAVFWAAGSVHSRGSSAPRNPFLAAGMQMLGAAVFLLLAGLVSGEGSQVDLARIGWTGVLALAWLVVCGSLAAYSCYLIALRLLPLAVASTYAFVNPLIAVLIGFALFGEPLNLQVGISAICTVAAIAVLLLSQRRDPATRH